MWKLLKNKLLINVNLTFGMLLGASAVALFSSYAAEYVWGQSACKLCKIQRLIFVFLAFGSVLGFLIPLKEMARKFCLLVLLGSCIVASYHALIQFGLLKDRCSMQVKITDLDSFETALLINSSASCSSHSWTVFNVPIAVVNGCFSFLLLILASKGRKRVFRKI